MMKKRQLFTIFVSVLLSVITMSGVIYISGVDASPLLGSGSPTVVSYQGHVTEGGSPYTGTGYFKFAVVDGSGSATYWSNDGTSSGGGEPKAAVQLGVNDGLFHVLLGDTNLSNMTALPPSAFDGTDRYLRVWFSSDGSSFTQLSPDRRVASVPYALQAEEAAKAGDADTLDGSDSSSFASQSDVSDLQSRVSDLENKLSSVSVSGDEVYFTGVNVHIRDGTTDTDGTTNGKGNLIIGYNEDAGGDATRNGSHNLVIGPENSYTSFGGLVAGSGNTVTGIYASVTGGFNNVASGGWSSVSGGMTNQATAINASVTGGSNNQASGRNASVHGGGYNTASGEAASVLGGGGLDAIDANEAWADYSVVVGGKKNVAGDDSGSDRTVGKTSVISGGYLNSTSGQVASVSGGNKNNASGRASSVNGGYDNNASGDNASISGGKFNIASGNGASVHGGQKNKASGRDSVVLGGGGSGGLGNEAWADISVVVGGQGNTAGDVASGDRTNGEKSVISGGLNRSVTGDFDWKAGKLFEDD